MDVLNICIGNINNTLLWPNKISHYGMFCCSYRMPIPTPVCLRERTIQTSSAQYQVIQISTLSGCSFYDISTGSELGQFSRTHPKGPRDTPTWVIFITHMHNVYDVCIVNKHELTYIFVIKLINNICLYIIQILHINIESNAERVYSTYLIVLKIYVFDYMHFTFIR